MITLGLLRLPIHADLDLAQFIPPESESAGWARGLASHRLRIVVDRLG